MVSNARDAVLKVDVDALGRPTAQFQSRPAASVARSAGSIPNSRG